MSIFRFIWTTNKCSSSFVDFDRNLGYDEKFYEYFLALV